ncbi:hypothetical protein ACGFRG_08685 [Streptomyces sp. NPDC048696]|uniref:hypothetical protein n=1 Tax=Streptomyces sp. NPDC048696 TaxID=3365585 RepID=UPI003716FA58
MTILAAICVRLTWDDLDAPAHLPRQLTHRSIITTEQLAELRAVLEQVYADPTLHIAARHIGTDKECAP